MILVSGATGLVGQDVLRVLSAGGRSTLALVRSEAGASLVRSLGAEVAFGTVEDPQTWHQSFPDIEAVVHSAAIITDRTAWSRFEAVNVDGTKGACDLALSRGVPLVHISSVAVYGRRAADDAPYSITESYDRGHIEPREYYARSKKLAENVMFESVAQGLQACALRPCVIYGPGDRQLIPRLLKLARRGWFPRVGTGTRPMALVHSRSVAEAVLAAFESGRGWGKAFNVTGDALVTRNDMRDAASTVIGKPLRSIAVPAAPALALARVAERGLRLLGPKRYPGTLQGAVRFLRGGDPYDADAARQILGWRPTIDHRAALIEAFAAVIDRNATDPA